MTTIAKRVLASRAPDKPPVEKFEQRAIVDVARKLGFEVDQHSQYRASHIAEGVPDLYLTHARLRIDAWFEVKPYRPNGYQIRDRLTWVLKPRSLQQARFGLRCIEAGVLYHWGALRDFEEFATVLGLGYFARPTKFGAVFTMTPQAGSAAQAQSYRGLSAETLIRYAKDKGNFYRAT